MSQIIFFLLNSFFHLLAPSTALILGSTPSLAHPALGSKRAKRDIIRQERQKEVPGGTGLEGRSIFS
jgi:hypothetical protein